MLTILEQSVHGELRNFRTITWKSSNQSPNTLTKTFWSVKTNFRKYKFIKYLQIKALVGECNYTEYRCLLDAPGVLEDDLFIDALRAWKTDVPKKILWQRLATLQRLLQQPAWELNLYYTFNKVVKYELIEARQSIRKVKKYSGYVRNSSQVGSKRKNQSFSEQPESFEWNTSDDFDFYHYLTVGEFSSVPSGLLTFTLKMSKERTKR